MDNHSIMINVLRLMIDRTEQISQETLIKRFYDNKESERSTLTMFMKRCKEHLNLITSPEWETLDSTEKEIIIKYTKKDMCTMEELTR